jgi:glycosyltransferase involved in cell wall biosynthesis
MTTVIVPAHNEASVIEACLDSIITQQDVEQIIVACNGCTDNTVEIVRKKYPDLLCLDIKKPSKTNALNEAEKHSRSFPVYYLDADTRISDNSIVLINQHLATGKSLLAAPTPIIDTSNSSWLVKQYYKIWLTLPYISEGVIGTCSFIISEKGRKRFENFPDVINDDGFVRCCFDGHERANVADAHIYIKAPKTLYSLIKIKTRARLGNMELDTLNLCAKPKQANYSTSLKEKLLSKQFIPTSIYITIAFIIRVRALYQFRKLESYIWEKDFTSR